MSGFLTPIDALSGVGEVRARALRERGLETVVDLLLLAPTRYDSTPPLADAATVGPKVLATLVGIVERARKVRQRRGGHFLDMVLRADGRELRVRFWNRGWLADRVTRGDRVAISGAMAPDGSAFSGTALTVLADDAALDAWLRRLEPVHPKIPGIPEGILRRLVVEAQKIVDGLEDPLPVAVRRDLEMPTLQEAFRLIHVPASRADAERGGERLLFDRLLSLALGARLASRGLAGEAPPIPSSERVRSRIRARLPFAPTPEQEAALAVILDDIARPQAMRRLLLGDVGSGKTAVAVAAILAAVAAGKQALFVAPTDVLASQHAALLERWLSGSRVRLGALTSRSPAPKRRAVAQSLAKGEIDILVGTHVALAAEVAFADLGIVVVDEQHRFGVLQRLAARRKGKRPHVLALSATPIPRSLALALFGDLAMTRIAARPGGRKTPPARLSDEPTAYADVRRAVASGERAFVVFPTIAGAETPSVEGLGRKRVHRWLDDLRTQWLHGRLPHEDQRAALEAFRSGAADVLVATSIIEVGVDVPEATVMVIEGAERFGLASLHQLRGRVGRGERSARVHLVPSPTCKPEALNRLRMLEKEDDGFKLAEADLLLRGPGDLVGVRQHGFGGSLPIAEGRDRGWLEVAERVASELLAASYDVRRDGWFAGLADRLGGMRFDPVDPV